MRITGKKNIQSSAYEQAVEYLRPGGTLLVVGLPAQAKINAPIFWTVVKGISILGSYVGCAPLSLIYVRKG
jgi:D-arabinose 1-dehydrogenase-like Zn-dependent alcohol dehydrogenase